MYSSNKKQNYELIHESKLAYFSNYLQLSSKFLQSRNQKAKDDIF